MIRYSTLWDWVGGARGRFHFGTAAEGADGKRHRARRPTMTVERQCFVCAGDDSDERLLGNVCACETFVHASCQQKMMMKVPSHRSHCAVCREEYMNVTYKWERIEPTDDEAAMNHHDACFLPMVLLFHAAGSLAGCVVCMLILPIVCDAAFVIAYNSASPLDRAITD